MDDRHDDLGTWLSGWVDPLYPPPGTFDHIGQRARRCKYRKLAVTEGSAAVIVTAAIAFPQVVNVTVLSPPATSALAGHPASVSTRTGGGIGESSAASRPAFPVPSPAAPLPVPADFRPSPVTFVGTDTGPVIGQAGTPGYCATEFCMSVTGTDDAGDSWTGVPAPLTGAADSGATGVSQIRFLKLDDGWAFGPQLRAPHDGGQTWTQVDTYGQRAPTWRRWATGCSRCSRPARAGGRRSPAGARASRCTPCRPGPTTGPRWAPRLPG